MKKFLLIFTILFCLFAFVGPSYAWDEGGWDTLKVPFIRKTAAPAVTDDDYGIPYLWVDETNDKMYLLIDNTPGAAVWQEVIYTGGSPSFVTVDLTDITDGNFPYMQAASAGFGDSPFWRTDANTVTLKATTGQAVTLVLSADAAEDNADNWKVEAADSGDMTIYSKQSGAWVAVMTVDNTGNITITSATTSATSAPAITGYDSDQADLTETTWRIYGNATTLTDDGVVGDLYLQTKGFQGTAGALETAIHIDGSAQAIRTYGAIINKTTTVSAEGPTNNVDVTGVNVVFVDTGDNNVTIGGFTGGISGQAIDVVIIDASNNTTLEHNEGGGSQDILLAKGDDETFTASYGGWRLVCDGTNWYQAGNVDTDT